MSLGHFLIHTCTIRRLKDASTARDGYGAEDKTEYDHLTDVPCRLVVDAERVASPDMGALIETTYRLVVEADMDVANADKITDIALDDGTVDADTYEVRAVLTRRGLRARHITLELWKVE